MVMKKPVQSKKIKITSICSSCQKTSSIKVEEGDYLRWKDGIMIQQAFPYLSPGEREQLITGMCDGCFEDLDFDD